jgi:hypothetical protein
MKNANDYRKENANLRDSILMDIAKIIRKCSNWYLPIISVRGKLTYNVIDDQESEMIQSVTVKDFGDKGEKEVVWIGVCDEDHFVEVDELSTELLINVLEAMQKEVQ